jgi:hypothetical protein
VIVLSQPVPTDVVGQYAQLPGPGFADELKSKTRLDLVGYGMQGKIHLIEYSKKPLWTGFGDRMYAPTELVSGEFAWSDEFIRIAMNPGGDSGGMCFGDSGGPVLPRQSSTILAVNSYGVNYNCVGVGYANRIDVPEILDWIKSFLK